MKELAFSILSCAMIVGFSSSIAQTPMPSDQLLRLIQEVETQQAQMAANQGKIETKLSEIGETVRVARIFSAGSQ
jgi:peptidoglycan hydrolase CwlO-like protein